MDSYLVNPKKRMFLAVFAVELMEMVIFCGIAPSLPFVRTRHQPEFLPVLSCDSSAWARCLSWNGWLPALSPRRVGSSWAVAATDCVDAALERALGAYPVHPAPCGCSGPAETPPFGPLVPCRIACSRSCPGLALPALPFLSYLRRRGLFAAVASVWFPVVSPCWSLRVLVAALVARPQGAGGHSQYATLSSFGTFDEATLAAACLHVIPFALLFPICPRRLPFARRPLRSAVPQHAPQATLTRPPGAVWFLSQGALVASDLGVPSGVAQWRGCVKLPQRSPRHARLSSLLGYCEWPWSCSSRCRLRGSSTAPASGPSRRGCAYPGSVATGPAPVPVDTSRRLRPRARGPHAKCEKKRVVVRASNPCA